MFVLETSKSTIAAVCATAALSLTPAMSAATTINFESGYVDNQILTDGTALLDDSGAASIVSVSTNGSNTMSVEAHGNDTNPDGFVYGTIPRGSGIERRDVESPLAGSSLGNFFLRNTSAFRTDNLNLLPLFSLSFAGGVSSVSAEIWDIDGNDKQGSEGWEVIARFSGGATQSIFSPIHTTKVETTSLDAQEWTFSFMSAGNDIEQLDFIFTGTKQHGVGVAFDNLTFAQVPLPLGGALLLSALGAGAVLHRRKRAA